MHPPNNFMAYVREVGVKSTLKIVVFLECKVKNSVHFRKVKENCAIMIMRPIIGKKIEKAELRKEKNHCNILKKIVFFFLTGGKDLLFLYNLSYTKTIRKKSWKNTFQFWKINIRSFALSFTIYPTSTFWIVYIIITNFMFMLRCSLSLPENR